MVVWCVCDLRGHELFTTGLGVGWRGSQRKERERQWGYTRGTRTGTVFPFVGGILFYARRKNSRIVRARIVESLSLSLSRTDARTPRGKSLPPNFPPSVFVKTRLSPESDLEIRNCALWSFACNAVKNCSRDASWHGRGKIVLFP